MPNAKLNTAEKLFSIQFISNNILSVAVVEQCTYKKQMNYHVSVLAYVQDVVELDKKINTLTSISHFNDVSMVTIQDKYTYADDVNEVLSNYVLKTDLTPAIDLSYYAFKTECRQENDLSHSHYQNHNHHSHQNIHQLF